MGCSRAAQMAASSPIPSHSSQDKSSHIVIFQGPSELLTGAHPFHALHGVNGSVGHATRLKIRKICVDMQLLLSPSRKTAGIADHGVLYSDLVEKKWLAYLALRP